MMFTSKEMAELRDYFHQIAGDREEAKLMKYSGRGMFGRYCVGIAASNPMEAVMNLLGHFAVEAMEAERHGDSEAEEPPEERQLYDTLFRVLTSNVRTDSLGYDTVVYFPDWEWDPELKEEVNDEDDEDEG